MESDSPNTNAAKTDMLRGVIAEKLTLAAREILAVVERTVTEYEDEALGFRQEIDRQRRLLELLQPEIKMEPLEDQQLFSLCGAGGGKVREDQEQHKHEPRVEDSQGLGFPCYSEDEEEEEEEEVAQQIYETAPRLVPSAAQPDRRRADRPWISDTQNLVDLRICILEDSRIDVLSKKVFQKYPLHELQCRRGLQEVEFLDLLRSTFPQLAADEPFDVFKTDVTRKLQPLKLDSWTPEGILKTIKATGNSALYIRLKKRRRSEADEEFRPLQRHDAASADDDNEDDDSSSTSDPSSKPRRRKTRKARTHVMIRIRILDHLESDVLSARVYQMCPLHELQCPRGLQEADFLYLLRSTFPQLAADEPFGLFVTDKSRKLRPLKVQSLTTEEVERVTRTSTLYIRVKPSGRFDASARQFLQTEDVPFVPNLTRQTPRVQSGRRKPGRSQISHVDFRIRILEDPEMEVVTPQVFLKNKLRELRCPRDLQEADFLDLLRSTIPELAAQKHFDVLIADRNRELQLLRVDALTPAEIHRAVTLTRNTTLFIRLKQRAGSSTPNPIRLHTRVQSYRKKPHLSRSDSHVDLRLRILEDSHMETVTPQVLQNYPIHELQVHRGLQEADFLKLLRSTFPQLAANVSFELLKLDRNKMLHPLNVDSLTPEHIFRANKLARTSALFIRLKTPEEVQAGARKFVPLQNAVVAAREPSPLSEQTMMHVGVLSDQRKAARPRLRQSSSHVELRIRLVQDSDIDVMSPRAYQKCPLYDLECPRGLQEADFVDLLRSTFPQLAADEPFDVLTVDRYKRLQPLKVGSLTPEKLYRAVKMTGNIVVFIRPKAPEEVQTSTKKPDFLQRNFDATKESPSLTEPTGLHTSNPHLQGANTGNILSSSSLTHREDLPLGECGDGLEYGGFSTLKSLILYERSELADGLVNVKTSINNDHQLNGEPEKTKGRQQVKHSVRMKEAKQKMLIHSSSAPRACKVCRVLRGSASMLIKHAWSHVDERERLCGVCGEQLESAELLRSHLQTHQKTHSCNICGKSFLTVNGYKGHLARHKGNTPYKCRTCHKAFPDKWVLSSHESRVHGANKLHRKKFSKLKLKLYNCKVCGKRFRRLETFSQHVALHSGSTAAADSENHDGPKPFSCNKCNKTFLHKSNVMIHMRVHTGEKPYKCKVCGKGFSQGHCVKRHLATHQRKKIHQQTEQLTRVEIEDACDKMDVVAAPHELT